MRAVHIGLTLSLILLAPACENGPPWATGDAPDPAVTTPDFGPTAAYNRRLLFLGPGAELPTAAVFDFTALSDSLGIRRGVRARLADGQTWRPLLDAGWEMAPMREPWRLVPHGPLTFLVGSSGELAALIHRDSVTTRLQIGASLAEHSPDVGTQLVLRSGRLIVDTESVPGVVLDAQLGRAVNPELVARDPGVEPTDTTAPATSPTPIARAGGEALLLSNGGYYVVLTAASSGALAWVRNAGRDDVRPGAHLQPTAWDTAGASGLRVPTAWRVVSPDDVLTGELTARATAPVALRGAGDLEALAYVLVSGWIEDRTVRRDVFGLVRHVR